MFSVHCHPLDPRLVASGGMDDRAFLWQVEPGVGAVERELLGHADSVIRVRFSPDGGHLATAGMDGTLRVWSLASEECVAVEGPSAAITCMEWHPKGPVIAAGSEDGSVWMWNTSNGDCMQVMCGHTASVSSLRFSPDGRLLLTSADDGSLIIWSPKDGQPMVKYSAGRGFHPEAVTCLAVHPNGQVVFTGGSDGSIRCSQVMSSNVVKSLELHTASIEAISISDFASPLMVATASLDGSVGVWDASTLSLRTTLQHGETGITCVAWIPKSPQLVTGTTDGELRRWDARTGECVQLWRSRSGTAVLDISVSAIAKMVVAGFDDGIAAVYDYE